MSEADNVIPFPQRGARPPQVHFNRHELGLILRIYGRMVAEGEWRDYAIDSLQDAAFFSIFRRTSERPLYAVRKTPADAQKQGAYALLGADGRILKRGRDLEAVLSFFNRLLLRPAED
ncbi:DUF2794 domain-containing protein [Neomegalonema perideroedes]|uniref:DUF2794 domain-containing protein n=1 Tax=Neomegalonema perideroedes TaxID=217219 RepID=UPI00036206B2|nr:DUF2794 domain-containing protein [Neomegalonema perideroedes]